ncbi:hypothetical protein A2U01_0019468, partial [Trifolium medium]|nr:hypothetical protein [Trifolium medium]
SKNSFVRQKADVAMVEGEPRQTSLSSKTTYTPDYDRGTTTRTVVPKQPKPSTKETEHDPRKKQSTPTW